MAELGRFTRELRARLWKPSVADEVRDEMQAHLEMLEAEYLSRGMPPHEAREAARRQFGDRPRLEAECRTLGEERDARRRRTEWMGEFGQDVRQALRQLRSAPRFAVVAILTLVVGLGASTTIFGVANAVLLRPLPFPDADRLVLTNEVTPTGMRFSISEPDYLDWVARGTRMTHAGFEGRRTSLVVNGESEQLQGAVVTASFFPVLGVAPALGRTILPEEDRKGGDSRVAVISDGLWARRFGGSRDVLGAPISLDGVTHRIVGVMPPDFDFPGRVDVWTPLVPVPEYPRNDRRMEGVARLTPGVTAAQASDELRRIATQLSSEYPVSNDRWSADVLPFKEWFVSPQLQSRVLALLATVALLLVMSCVNVANLLLSRAAVREREMAVRAALGAGRWRIARQLLTESLVLSVIGAAGGVAVATAAVPLIRRIGGDAISRLDELAVDWRVLAFAVPACLLTGLVFGLAPALRLSRTGRGTRAVRLHDLLRSGTRVAESGRLRNGLIVMSVALAMVLLVGAALVGGSFLKLMRVDLGFSAEPVLIANVALTGERYDSERAMTFVREARERLQGVAGVHAVGAINIPPFGVGNTAMRFAPAERANETGDDYLNASWRAVTPGLFRALEIPLKAGRDFSDDDGGDAPEVIIVNETLARQAWPGENPIGRRLALGNSRVMTVVGVVGDTRHLVLDSLPPATMYFNHAQFPWRSMWLAVRTDSDPMTLAGALRREVAAIDPLLPVAGVQPLTALVSNRSAEPRLTMLIFGIFATAALLLAAVGLYGIISYGVSQRTREIGVTLALGAPRGRVVRRVPGEGMQLAAAGVVAGALVALWGTGILRAILYDTEPGDAWTYAGVAGLLLAVSALASAVPAWRAARLDPVEALRGE